MALSLLFFPLILHLYIEVYKFQKLLQTKIGYSLKVNSIGAEVLEFIADFGKPTAPAPAAIVACVPKKVHIDGTGETDFKISPIEVSEAIISGLKEPIEAEPEVQFLKEFSNAS